MDFARDAAGRSLIEGAKSVDVCQAYLLMAVYPVPKKKWAEDRSWLLMGLAIRCEFIHCLLIHGTMTPPNDSMAIELELHQPPPSTCNERESLNRTRTWLNCYCVDGSHAIQFGKMPMLRLDDYMARNSRHWYKSSFMNIPFDIHLCAYVQIIILVAEWRSVWMTNPNSAPTYVGEIQNSVSHRADLCHRKTTLLHQPLKHRTDYPRRWPCGSGYMRKRTGFYACQISQSGFLTVLSKRLPCVPTVVTPPNCATIFLIRVGQRSESCLGSRHTYAWLYSPSAFNTLPESNSRNHQSFSNPYTPPEK